MTTHAPSSLTSTRLVCAPITALAFLSSTRLLVAQGPYLKIYTINSDSESPSRLLLEQRVLQSNRIHALVRAGDANESGKATVLVLGGKEVALVRVNYAGADYEERPELHCLVRWKARDWLHAGAFLKGTQVILCTGHNSILHYDLDQLDPATQTPKLLAEYICEKRPLIWSAAFTRSNYAKLEDVKLAVGTIMNEILVWRPSSAEDYCPIERRLVGHNGSVFFVSFAPCIQHATSDNAYTYLASGSDDRDIRVWRWLSLGRQAESQTESVVLRGHTHRPWRATWTSDGSKLVSVGEDLRCMVWQVPRAAELFKEIPRSPLTQYKGHEGKNIWSVAVSPDDAIIVTGGSDGAVRLWPMQDAGFKTILQVKETTLAAFQTSDRHVLAVTESGEVYRASTGTDAFELVHRISSDEDHTNTRVQPIVLIDEHIEEQKDIACIINRDGQIIRLSLSPPYTAATAQFDYTPLVAAIRRIDNVANLAMYDHRKRKVVLLIPSRCDGSLQVASTSGNLQTERKPSRLCWMSETTLVLSDSIATVWLYEIRSGTIELVHEARLQEKGIVSLSAPPSRKGARFLVGQPNGCSSYRIARRGAQDRFIELVSIDCLNNGSVRQILDTSEGLEYLCANNAAACVVDDHGEVLVNFTPPSAAADKLQVVRHPRNYHFYAMTPRNLLHRSYSRTPAPIVQKGLQGREIWSLDFHQPPGGDILCATSAEDATVKISLGRSTSDGFHFETVYRWSDVDGALQNVKWAPHASASERALLFVTSKESLYALCVSLRVTGEKRQRSRVDVRPAGRADKLNDRNEDSRIMTLVVVSCQERYILLAGYSDGYLRWWVYREDEGTFRILHTTAWHDRCLLSVKLLVDHDKQVLFAASGATDGRIAIWQYTLADLTNLHSEAAKCPSAVLDTVHQSGVNCLDFRLIGHGGLCIISGGDDNAISCTTLDTSTLRVQQHSTEASAHASSIKGIAFLTEDTFVSTSTDQRVILWQVCEGGLKRLSSTIGSVADVADLGVLQRTAESWLVGISGIGMEVLQAQ